MERVLIHRIAEMSDNNPGEKHAGGAQADAAEFQTAQRHSKYTDKGERADGVCDGLRLVEIEKPAHLITQIRSAIPAEYSVKERARTIGLRTQLRTPPVFGRSHLTPQSSDDSLPLQLPSSKPSALANRGIAAAPHDRLIGNDDTTMRILRRSLTSPLQRK